ncbi:MAG: M20/M25/M40 family metallo-hydrolase, partial [Pseudomonadota bacterium]
LKGQGGHASMPQAGRDVITIGADVVQALQTIVARRLAPGSGAVVSITEFVADGQRNVLPGKAVLKGDARARSPDDRDAIEQFMHQIVSGVASAHGISAEVTFNTEFVETINADAPTDSVVRAANSAGLETIPDRPPMSFSEDFAHFAAAIPGCFMLLGNGTDGPNGQPLHSNNYDLNDALLPIGVSLWSALVR